MKIVRIQATDEEQSRAYGIFEGGRGVFNAAHLAVATAIFGVFEARTMPYMGIDAIIWFYSLAPLIVGIIFIFILKEPDTVGETGSSQQVSFKQILSVLKMPVMWLIIIMIYTSYTFNMSSYYFTPYASNIIGVTAVIAAILTVMSQYIRPFAATIGGFAGDKAGKSKTMIVGYILMVAGVVIMDMTGKMSSDTRMILVVAACVLVYAGMFSNFGLYFSFISEAGHPRRAGRCGDRYGVHLRISAGGAQLHDSRKAAGYISGLSGVSPEPYVYDRNGYHRAGRGSDLDKKICEKAGCGKKRGKLNLFSHIF